MRLSRNFVLAGIAALGLALAAAAPAAATPVTPGSGWIEDTAYTLSTPSAHSPVTFTLTGHGLFSITDAFLPGDIYEVIDTTTGDVLDTTTFTLFSTPWTAGSGTGDAAWTDKALSHGQLALNPGSYSFALEDIHDAGLPAGFFFRVDNVTSVPEPASLVLFGAALAGLALTVGRRRARRG